MIPSRQLARSSIPRAARLLRTPCRQQVRRQSTATPSPKSTPPSSTGSTTSSSTGSTASSSISGTAFATGIAGGLAGAAIFYGIYSYTPAGATASKLNKAVKEAENSYEVASKKLQENTPSADEAVSYIKEFAYSYVGWLPGGRAYVDAAFSDWDKVHDKHREEADKAINEAYKQFQEISKSGLSLETANKAYEVIAELTKKIAGLAGNAMTDILENHPQVKEKLGGNVDQLRRLGDQYGPEAKKQVDETWGQVKDIFAGGFSADNLDKAQKLIDEKVEQVRKFGDEAWKKGYEEVKPMLEKNPKIKDFIEKNVDALKQGNAAELFGRVKKAFSSGDWANLEGYIRKAIEQAKSNESDEATGGWVDVGKYLKMVPEGDSILGKLQKFSEVAEKNRDEGEKLLKETVQELQEVLEKKSERAQKIVKDAQKEAS